MAIQEREVGYEAQEFAKEPTSGERYRLAVINKEYKELKKYVNDNTSSETYFMPVQIVGGESDGFDQLMIMLYVGKDGEYGQYSVKPLEKWFTVLLGSTGMTAKFIEQFGDEPDYFSEEVEEFMVDNCVGASFEAIVSFEVENGKEMTDKDTGDVKTDKDGNIMYFKQYNDVKFKKVKICEKVDFESDDTGASNDSSFAEDEEDTF